MLPERVEELRSSWLTPAELDASMGVHRAFSIGRAELGDRLPRAKPGQTFPSFIAFFHEAF